jgi:DNA repair photolyase
MVAPVIPGLNDRQLPDLMRRARDAGAQSASWTLLRLPGPVKAVFEERVRAALPLAADKILGRIRETRGGTRLSDSRFHSRHRGQGEYADLISSIFSVTAARLGLRPHRGEDGVEEEDPPSTFRRPPHRVRQLSLF